MAEMFGPKAVRHALMDLIADNAISIDVAGSSTVASILKSPPSGGWVQDDKLPAIYVYCSEEDIRPEARGIDARSPKIEIMLQAKGSGGEVLDQLDDLQEAIEILIANSSGLGGVVRSIRPLGAKLHTERGTVVFGARKVTFQAEISLARRSPMISV